MAYTDVAIDRKIVAGMMPAKVTIAGAAVNAGDPLMYSSGWKLAANTSGAPAILIAGEAGAVGDIITAYGMAIVEVTHTAANVPTMGAQIAVADTGIYAEAGTGLQDVGYIVEIDADSLHSRLLLCPMIVELDLAGT